MINSLRPTVVPRKLTPEGRLEFYVVFGIALQDDANFPKDQFFGTSGNQLQAYWPSAVLKMLHGGGTPVQVHVVSKKFPVGQNYDLEVIPYPEIETVQDMYPRDAARYAQGLSIDPADQGHSENAWTTIFQVRASAPEVGPAVATKLLPGTWGPSQSLMGLRILKLIDQPPAQSLKPLSPLRTLLADQEVGANLKANPGSSSDLRPVHRLDSPDLTAYRKAINDRANPANHAKTGNEFRRVERLLKIGRNRDGGGRAGVAKSRYAGLETPSWQDLFGRASQFPGLQRRLKLAIYCAIDIKGGVLGDDNGHISLQLPQETFLGLEVQEVATAFVSHKDSNEELNYFRADPKGTSVDAPITSSDAIKNLWPVFGMLSGEGLEISQADALTAAARVVNAASSESEPPPLQDAPQHAGLAILKKANEDAIGQTSAADDLKARLVAAQKLEKHFNSATQMKAGLASIQTVFGVDRSFLQTESLPSAHPALPAIKFLRDANDLVDRIPAPVLTADQLIRGVSPEVWKDNADEWTNLCVRSVKLKNAAGHTVLEWIEEGFVGLSMSSSPAPAVGTVTWREYKKTSPDPITKKTTVVPGLVTVGVVGTDNRYIDPVQDKRTNIPTGRVFNIDNSSLNPTQLISLFRPVTRFEDIVKEVRDDTGNIITHGDTVHIVADTKPGLGLVASAISVYPVFTSSFPELSRDDSVPQLLAVRAHNEARQENFAVWIHGAGIPPGDAPQPPAVGQPQIPTPGSTPPVQSPPTPTIGAPTPKSVDHGVGTHYLDSNGNEISDPNPHALDRLFHIWTKVKSGFFVEGERRAMLKDLNLVTTIDTIPALLKRIKDDAKKLITALEAYKVKSGSYPADLSTLKTTGPFDPWGMPYQYSVQTPLLFGSPSYTLSSCGPDGIANTADDIDLKAIPDPTEYLTHFAIVNSPALPGVMMRSEHVDMEADEPRLFRTPFASSDDIATSVGAGRWLMLNGKVPLTVVRGWVKDVQLDFAGKVSLNGGNVTFNPIAWSNLFNLVPTANVLDGHTVRGLATLDASTVSTANIRFQITRIADITPVDPDSGAVVPDETSSKSSDEARTLAKDPVARFRVIVDTLDGRQLTLLCSDDLISKLQKSPADTNRFVEPQVALGQFLEFFCVPSPDGLRIRYLPQHPFGSLSVSIDHATNYTKDGALLFSDGSKLDGLDLRSLKTVNTIYSKLIASLPRQGSYKITAPVDPTVAGPVVSLIPRDMPLEKITDEPFFVMGEVVATETSDDKHSVKLTVHPGGKAKALVVTFNSPVKLENGNPVLDANGNPQYLPICYQPIESLMPPARVEDLEPGDFVFVLGVIGADGRITAKYNPATYIQVLSVSLIGAMSEIKPDVKVVQAMREGQGEIIGYQLTTPAGLKRQVWSPDGGLFVADQVFGFGITKGIFARTITCYAAPEPFVMDAEILTQIETEVGQPFEAAKKVLKLGSDEERLLTDSQSKLVAAKQKMATDAAQNLMSPVQSSVSNRLAFFQGWSLMVQNAEDGDHADKSPEAAKLRKAGQQSLRDIYQYQMEVTLPDSLKIPGLRYGYNYSFRLRRADLAGNHFFDEPIPADAVLDAKDLRKPILECAQASPITYQRLEAAPVAPMFAPVQKSGAIEIRDEDDPNSPPIQSRLVCISDPFLDPNEKDNKSAPILLQDFVLLPPPSSVASVIENSCLDRLDEIDQMELFEKHEAHFDSNTFALNGDTLNYFPDPALYSLPRLGTLGIDATLADESGVALKPWASDGRQIALPRLEVDVTGSNPWPKARALHLKLTGSNTPSLSADQNALTFSLPKGWSGKVRFRAGKKGAFDLNDKVLADLPLIHATTAPRLRPSWTSLDGDPARHPGDTLEKFSGTMLINPRTTAGIRITAYWNDYWDETVPLHLVEAGIKVPIFEGKVIEEGISIVNPGAGYGTQGRVVYYLDGLLQDDTSTSSLPVIEPSFTGGKLTGLVLRRQGVKLDGDLIARVLPRRPLFRFATAKVKSLRPNGGIAEVEMGDGGGYYTHPPIIVFHDMKGDGYGARGLAKLNANGEVVSITTMATPGYEDDVSLPAPGLAYSDSENVVVGIYTNAKDLGEILVPVPGTPSSDEYLAEQNRKVYTEKQPLSFPQDFGDLRARSAIYVGTASCRFRNIITTGLRSRTATPQRLAVRATAPPPRPEIHHIAYSYRWFPRRTNQPIMFTNDMATMTIRREGAIRCYLRRGWHASGEELLAVVVMQAENNSVELRQETQAPASKLSVQERLLVSRWGYDPAWDEIPTPPLALDDLTNQLDFIPYTQIPGLAETRPRMAGIALHRVEYDERRGLWYADIGLRTPPANLPFLQLALARYQANALPGIGLSDVILPDLVRVPGDRKLQLARDDSTPRKIDLALRGAFSRPDDGKLPRRSVLVEVRQRDQTLAPEIEGPLVVDGSQTLDNQWDKGDFEATRVALQRCKDDSGVFRGSIIFPPDIHDESTLYLRVVEQEIYASDEPNRDRTGDADRHDPSNGGQTTVDWRPFTCAIALGKREVHEQSSSKS